MLTFNYKNRKTGARLAKMQATFYVDRDALVRATETAIVELLPASIDPSDVELAANALKRRHVETTLRSIVESYGSIYFESEHDLSVGGLEDLVYEAAEAVVSRLYPELSTEVAA